MKTYRLEVDLWKDSCWLVWPVNRKEAEEWYFKTIEKPEVDDLEQLENRGALSVMGNNHIIFLTNWNNDAEWFGILAHECTHIAASILRTCNVEEAEGTDEALAYTIDYLMRHFIAALTDTQIKQTGEDQSDGVQSVEG
jgi:hypothetical protein